MKVLLDTSFLVKVVENKADLQAELMKFGKPELLTLDLVVKELEILSSGRGNDADNASVALDFVRKYVKVLAAAKGSTDLTLLKVAKEGDMTVCTLDRKLKDMLLKGRVKVLTLRQGRYVVAAEKGC